MGTMNLRKEETRLQKDIDSSSLKVLYRNIDCIMNKYPEYLSVIEDCSPDIIITTETNPEKSMIRDD